MKREWEMMGVIIPPKIDDKILTDLLEQKNVLPAYWQNETKRQDAYRVAFAVAWRELSKPKQGKNET
jgi:hypothetical protein